MQADVTTLDAKKAGTVELPDDVFGLEPRPDILHRMVRYQLAKRRGGTRSVQDRSEVAHEWTLFDIQARFADVVSADEVLAYLSAL